jgi:two-component system CheB/CheR fusion protein
MFEELETSNEELQSANEEYQSANEELETSKEELQSANEELETVNTELHRKVAELDHANSDLQNLNNSTQIATIFLDAEMRIVSFTPAAGSVFRLIAGDVGRPITDLAAQFTDVGLAEDIKEVLRTLAARERDLPGAHGRQHYLMRILPYRTVHNVIEGVVITFTDVTLLKQAEERAMTAKIYAENIVDTIREPLLVLDDNLRVQSGNPAFFKTFQLTALEIEGQPLFELRRGLWDTPELRRLMTELLPEKKTLENFQVDYEFPNIGRKTLLLNARRIDHVDLILLVMEDITERKRAEDSLREVNQDLQHFAYAASHDLQEPLRMVTSYTQLLARQHKGKLDPLAEQSIAYAVEGARQMEMLLKGLRDYWSVKDGRIEETVIVDCNRVLEEAIKYLEPRIQESAAVITHDPLPAVTAEEIPMMLLFKNLVSNALKYTRSGEPPQIHIRAQKNANFWEFSVQDNGIGMEAQYLEKIFTPFKRLHSGEEYPGSGLGLAICQRIVERYRGRIWAESTYGQGSRFHFTIPAKGR